MDGKRTLLALAISFMILMAWQTYFVQPRQVATQAQSQAVQGQPVQGQPVQAQQVAPDAAATIDNIITPAQPASGVEKSQLSNDVATFNLTNWGARVEGAVLSKYTDVAGPEGKPLVMLQKGIDSIGSLGLVSGDLNPDALYSIVETTPEHIVYSVTTPTGLTVEKRYTLIPGRYDLDLTVSITNGGQAPLRDRAALYVSQDFAGKESKYVFQGPVYFKDNELEDVAVDDAVEDGLKDAGAISWAGCTQKYFMSILVPRNPGDFDISVGPEIGGNASVKVTLTGQMFDLPPGGVHSFTTGVFVGPKAKNAIVPVGLNLDRAVDYGWFQPISGPLMDFLHLLFTMVGNYGVAIIILTTLIKMLFWPLSNKSYKSMARMKELSPKVQILKDKYGENKEKLNKEMMHLWKTHKVNPMGGCLPILVQIPVFIALYRGLMYSIDIRHAPFMFWIQDLAAKDPYYVTPIVMGASMFIQQKLTPASGASEGQMKFMMYGMPVMFTWMFMDFPSGLVIYWLWNNVLSIFQQWLMMRKKSTPKPAAPAIQS